MNTQRRTKVLIVGDYPMVRMDLRTVLELSEGITVIGETNPAGALTACKRCPPDVTVIDLDVDRRTGSIRDQFRAIRQLRNVTPNALIFALTSDQDLVRNPSSLPIDVDEVFLKGRDTDQLLERIQKVE